MENLLKDVIFPVKRNYMLECHSLVYAAASEGLEPPHPSFSAECCVFGKQTRLQLSQL